MVACPGALGPTWFERHGDDLLRAALECAVRAGTSRWPACAVLCPRAPEREMATAIALEWRNRAVETVASGCSLSTARSRSEACRDRRSRRSSGCTSPRRVWRDPRGRAGARQESPRDRDRVTCAAGRLRRALHDGRPSSSITSRLRAARTGCARRSPPLRAPRMIYRRRLFGGRLACGASGGVAESGTGFCRGRYDSPSTTRS